MVERFSRKRTLGEKNVFFNNTADTPSWIHPDKIRVIWSPR